MLKKVFDAYERVLIDRPVQARMNRYGTDHKQKISEPSWSRREGGCFASSRYFHLWHRKTSGSSFEKGRWLAFEKTDNSKRSSAEVCARCYCFTHDRIGWHGHSIQHRMMWPVKKCISRNPSYPASVFFCKIYKIFFLWTQSVTIYVIICSFSSFFWKKRNCWIAEIKKCSCESFFCAFSCSGILLDKGIKVKCNCKFIFLYWMPCQVCFLDANYAIFVTCEITTGYQVSL